MAPGFPRFSDGDVEIYFTADGEKYTLHSHALALHSSWFKASLSERWSGSGSSVSTREENTTRAYELRFDEGTDSGHLVRKGTETTAVFINKEDGPELGSDEEDSADLSMEFHDTLYYEQMRVIDAHKQLFSLIYHVPVVHEVKAGIFGIDIEEPLEILHATAKFYGCEDVVELHTQNAVRSATYNEEILQLCLNHPLTMLESAIKLKSDWIFIEAGMHLIGRSDRYFATQTHNLIDMELHSFFTEKRHSFQTTLKEVEVQLLLLDEGSDQHAVVATAYFRKWLGDHLRNNKGSKLGPGYAEVYRRIHRGHLSTAQGQDQKLEDYSRIFFPGKPDDHVKVEVALKSLLRKARETVAPVVNAKAVARHRKLEVWYSLTCTEITSDEVPWKKQVSST